MSPHDKLPDSALFKHWGTFRKGLRPRDIQLSFANHLEYSLSKDQYTATMRDLWASLCLAARDRLVERWIRTQQLYYKSDLKRVCYLSAEYLIGRSLVNNLINLEMYSQAERAMSALGLDLEELAGEEPDAGLGNGGLGRLAACFMDSLATLQIPAIGYGIRYEFGIFDQAIRDGRQVELPEEWLRHGNPWEIARPERTCTVKLYGRVEQTALPDGRLRVRWIDTQDVLGVPYDTPVAGFGCHTVNTLRLWSARASREFSLQDFQQGGYLKAVEQKNLSENISKVLYPSDNIYEGKELRLKQEYFFVSCSIQDILRRYLVNHQGFDALPDKVAIQLNDTHPALAVPELMRLLLDEHGLSWDAAFAATVGACGYTNHTLLSEAMEKWDVELFGRLLPRHLQIVYEINRRFLGEVAARHPGDGALAEKLSLVQEHPRRAVRMAHLAIVGSHSVNGVAALHSRLLREREFREMDALFPGRFHNKTNGITPRRWLLACNPGLAELITSRIGRAWITRLDELRALEPLADDAGFGERFREVKAGNKARLARITRDLTGEAVDERSLFDVQVKRIHEYKRQLLNILHVIWSWLRLKHGGEARAPRTCFIGGKAAPGYAMAKSIIELACHVAAVINADARTRDALRLVFLPNYRVTLAEAIIPAADVSQHISTAGYEASGTSNMKFALNGALTIGTLDGANIEIMEDVGSDNVFIFGLTAEEAAARRERHDPHAIIESDPLLREAIALVRDGFFSPAAPDLFHRVTSMLRHEDPYLILADFAAYAACQERVAAAYLDPAGWTRKAVVNVARMGRFSSDRTILEYNRDVWKAEPFVVMPPEGLPAPMLEGGTPTMEFDISRLNADL